MFAYCLNDPVNGCDINGFRGQFDEKTRDEETFTTLYELCYGKEYDYEWDVYDDVSFTDVKRVCDARKEILTALIPLEIDLFSIYIMPFFQLSPKATKYIDIGISVSSTAGGLLFNYLDEEMVPTFEVTKTKYYTWGENHRDGDSGRIHWEYVTERYVFSDGELRLDYTDSGYVYYLF